MKLALPNSLQIACIVFNVYKSMDSFCKHILPLINMSKTIRPGADLVGVCRGAHRLCARFLVHFFDVYCTTTT